MAPSEHCDSGRVTDNPELISNPRYHGFADRRTKHLSQKQQEPTEVTEEGFVNQRDWLRACADDLRVAKRLNS